MKISNNKLVSLSYELRTDGKDGDVIQTVNSDNPMTFIFGVDPLLPCFESGIENLKAGDDFMLLFSCEEAYGPAMEDAVVEIYKEEFILDDESDNDLFLVGNNITMVDTDGKRLNGKVIEVKDDSVVMDFNHPLAGSDLFFSGTILNVREATPEELEEAQANKCSPDNCSGCSGGCN